MTLTLLLILVFCDIVGINQFKVAAMFHKSEFISSGVRPKVQHLKEAAKSNV